MDRINLAGLNPGFCVTRYGSMFELAVMTGKEEASLLFTTEQFGEFTDRVEDAISEFVERRMEAGWQPLTAEELWTDQKPDVVTVYNDGAEPGNVIVEELSACYYAGRVTSSRIPLSDDVLAAIVPGRSEPGADPDITILLNYDLLAYYPGAVWVVLDETHPISEDARTARYNVGEVLSLACLLAIHLGHADPCEPFLVDAAWLGSYAARQTLIAVCSELDRMMMEGAAESVAAD